MRIKLHADNSINPQNIIPCQVFTNNAVEGIPEVVAVVQIHIVVAGVAELAAVEDTAETVVAAAAAVVAVVGVGRKLVPNHNLALSYFLQYCMLRLFDYSD